MAENQRIVWITGASSGIGRELARQYADQGAMVAVSARRKDLLDELVSEIRQKGGQAEAFVCDVADTAQMEQAVNDIIHQFGRLDIAIANAGFGVIGKIEDLSADDWNRQLATNVTGLAMTCKYAIPHLKKTKGRLALVGSVGAFIPTPQVGAYCASKAAVHAIGETLLAELKGTGVSCTVIHPGFVESNIARVDNEGQFHPEKEDPRPANLMWPTEKAARVMLRAIENRKQVFVFTMHGKIGVLMSRFFPGLLRKMVAGKKP